MTMEIRRPKAPRSTKPKTLVAVVLALGFFAAGAWAATRPAGSHTLAAGDEVSLAGHQHASFNAKVSRVARRLPMPRIARHPAKITTSTRARFVVIDGRQHIGFRCRLDRGAWRRCNRRIVYRRLGPGSHRFRVRALDGAGRRSGAARFGWQVAASKSFSIAAASSPSPPLYPGAEPAALPLVLSNPNDAPIYVTSLSVDVTDSPLDCDAATNLSLAQSSASSSTPVEIPAGASVTLPAQGVSAPAIQLVDLPVDQDACQGARFELSFSGSAEG